MKLCYRIMEMFLPHINKKMPSRKLLDKVSCCFPPVFIMTDNILYKNALCGNGGHEVTVLT